MNVKTFICILSGSFSLLIGCHGGDVNQSAIGKKRLLNQDRSLIHKTCAFEMGSMKEPQQSFCGCANFYLKHPHKVTDEYVSSARKLLLKGLSNLGERKKYITMTFVPPHVPTCVTNKQWKSLSRRIEAVRQVASGLTKREWTAEAQENHTLFHAVNR